jgi:hypothetical protein
MNLVKCTIAGFLAVAAFLVFFPLAVLFVMTLFEIHRYGGFGFETPQWQVHSPYFWIVIGVAFAIGFSLEQRRLLKQSAKQGAAKSREDLA